MSRSDRIRGHGLGFVAVGTGTGSMVRPSQVHRLLCHSRRQAAVTFFTTPNRLRPPFAEEELAILALPVPVPAAVRSVINLALS
jgi:hypothetical protein